ncbi:MAG: hypothetical protein U0U66_12700 [Cytophagaceae bacterium]
MVACKYVLVIIIISSFQLIYAQENALRLLQKSGLYRGIDSQFGITDNCDFNNDSISDIVYAYTVKEKTINYYITEIYSIVNDSTLKLLYKYDNLFSITCADRNNQKLCDSINRLFVYPDYCRAKFFNNKITMMFYIEASIFIEVDFTYTHNGYFSTRQRQYLDNPVTKDITLDYEITIKTEDGIYLQDFEFPEPL